MTNMKKVRVYSLFTLIVLLSWTTAKAQSSHCSNLSFELGDFTNWTGYISRYPVHIYPAPPLVWEQVAIPTARRHVIFPNNSALPPRFRYYARIGDVKNINNYPEDGGQRAWVQKLRYDMTIDSTNALLIAKFAFSLIYRSYYGNNQARFAFTLFDQKGDTIPDCANYAANAADPTLAIHALEYTPIEWNLDWLAYKEWTTVGANLIKYLGQTVTIEFLSSDDNQAGLVWGLATVSAECQPLIKTVSYCTGDTVARLNAPEDFKRYRWTDSGGAQAGINEFIEVADPPDGAVYYCTMTSETGCTITQQYVIRRGEFTVDYSSRMLDCKSNKVEMINLSNPKNELTYKWDFGDSTKSSEISPVHTFATSGLHKMSLTVSKPPTTCMTKLTKTIESFSPPLVGITGDSNFCHGLGTTLKAYGAWDYTWGDNSKADSIVVKPPGGNYKLIGRSSTGCVSDTIYKTVIEDPDWQLINQSDTVLCGDEYQATLAVTGAEKYLWSTNERTSSIVVPTPGDYFVTGTNSKGCQKTMNFVVAKYPLPEADFITSSTLLDTQHNTLTCSISAESGVTYSWDMGDGTTERGPTVQHTYMLTSKIQSYTIKLTAMSEQGCTNNATAVVEAVPVVSKVYPPNAFSPNATNVTDREFCLVTDGVKSEGYHFVVISRWNDIVYEIKNEIKGWNGRTKNGEYAPAGSYVWILEYSDILGKRHRQTGLVSLIY
jgi:PKD repeat protein